MTATAAWWFLPAVLPIAFYVTWTDLSQMKIRNAAVIALLVAYAVLGLFAFPFPVYLWQWVNVAALFAVGFVLWGAGLMGAGDAKFIAAAGPYFLVADLPLILRLFAACAMAGLLVHSVVRFTALHKITPDWKSWEGYRNFPKGLVLSMTLLFYLLVAVVYR